MSVPRWRIAWKRGGADLLPANADTGTPTGEVVSANDYDQLEAEVERLKGFEAALRSGCVHSKVHNDCQSCLRRVAQARAQHLEAVIHELLKEITPAAERGDNLRSKVMVKRLRAVLDPPQAGPPKTEIGSALTAVAFERVRQDEKWGGPDHDDKHGPHDWALFIREHLDKALNAARGEGGFTAYRRRLIEVAALAVAAYEVALRKADGSTESFHCPPSHHKRARLDWLGGTPITEGAGLATIASPDAPSPADGAFICRQCGSHREHCTCTETTCANCGGSGQLDASELVAPLGPGQSFTADCPSCRGRGIEPCECPRCQSKTERESQ